MIALEHPELRCTQVDLDPAPAAAGAASLLAELLATDGEDQVALRAGRRYVARLARCPEAAESAGAPEPSVRLELPRSGVLDELSLRPVPRRAPGAGEVEIRVHAAGLNFRDVMNALAMRDDQQPAGQRVRRRRRDRGPRRRRRRRGRRGGGGGPRLLRQLRHHPRRPGRPEAGPASASSRRPPSRLAFLTAHYALARVPHASPRRDGAHPRRRRRRRAWRRCSWLAGRGACSSPRPAARRSAAYLRRLGHRPRHGLAHRRRSPTRCLPLTGGRGVDVVLNSLTGELIAPRPGGAGSRRPLRGARQARGVERRAGGGRQDRRDLPHRAAGRGPRSSGRASSGRGCASCWPPSRPASLQPLPVQTFALDDAAAAFRYMAQARHIGKVVLVRPEALAEAPTPPAPRARRRHAT